jgi:hypothetical protein
MFNKLPHNSRKLLSEILDAENPTQFIVGLFENCTDKEDDELRSLLRELSQKGYIKIHQWADNVPLYIEINNSARTYAEREAEYERQKRPANSAIYNIGPITAKGSNLVLGNVVDSSMNIDSYIENIVSEVEEKGGEDKIALFALLDEVKELIDKIETTREIPVDKSLSERLSTHFEKHKWFYGAIINLLGNALLKTMDN